MTDFTLHPRLAEDTVLLADWTLCQLRLMNDRTFPWLVLVPRRADIREMHRLGPADQHRLTTEICGAAARLEEVTEARKMNVAALGNMVPQLHIHVIARFEEDPAWPGPIWGHGPADPYTRFELDEVVGRLGPWFTDPA